MNQHEYVEGVLQYYKDNDIVPGDPNEGPWEKAHYPLPRGMGDEVILLKPEHHFIQGILQSEDVGRCCFWAGDTRHFLRSDFAKRLPEDFFLLLIQLYDKWGSERLRVIGKLGGKIGGKVQGTKNAESGQIASIGTTETRRKGGITAGRIAVDSGQLASVSSKGGKVGGKITGKKHLESGHFERIRNFRYKCLVTGHISNSGGLSRYQKARGIDTSLRERVH